MLNNSEISNFSLPFKHWIAHGNIIHVSECARTGCVYFLFCLFPLRLWKKFAEVKAISRDGYMTGEAEMCNKRLGSG